MMVEHNQSANVPSGVGYSNKYKFNGKELDDATQMYYYGARYYDPKISIFVSVDPLAEQTMTPYQYVSNNPIMFTDPTGMSAYAAQEGSFTNGDVHTDSDGSWTFHEGAWYDNSLGEDNFLQAVVIPMGQIGSDSMGDPIPCVECHHKTSVPNGSSYKDFRNKSDEFLSGGFYFYDDEGKAKGDQSLRKTNNNGKHLEALNVGGIMQAGSIAKSMDGTGFKYGANQDEVAKITNAVLTGYNLGQSIPEAKVTIDISQTIWGLKPDSYGRMKPGIIQTIPKDTTVNLKDAPAVKYRAYQANGARYQEVNRMHFITK